jgi:hypothetical protein
MRNKNEENYIGRKRKPRKGCLNKEGEEIR